MHIPNTLGTLSPVNRSLLISLAQVGEFRRWKSRFLFFSFAPPPSVFMLHDNRLNRSYFRLFLFELKFSEISALGAGPTTSWSDAGAKGHAGCTGTEPVSQSPKFCRLLA